MCALELWSLWRVDGACSRSPDIQIACNALCSACATVQQWRWAEELLRGGETLKAPTLRSIARKMKERGGCATVFERHLLDDDCS